MKKKGHYTSYQKKGDLKLPRQAVTSELIRLAEILLAECLEGDTIKENAVFAFAVLLIVRARALVKQSEHLRMLSQKQIKEFLSDTEGMIIERELDEAKALKALIKQDDIETLERLAKS